MAQFHIHPLSAAAHLAQRNDDPGADMQNISAAWLYPLILVAGALQACGPPMNNALREGMQNPWLASLVSFLPVVAFIACLFLCLPTPLPTT
jgi:transporter family-2 protein